MKSKIFYYVIITYILLFPLFSYANGPNEDNFKNLGIEIDVSATTSDIPKINAKHAVVIERNSNLVLFGKNENETCKMASTTKIMSALVVLEKCHNLNETVTVSKKAARNWWFKTRVIHK